MAVYLKRRIAREITDDLDRQVRHTVEAILEDVKKRGERAVRELSEKYDKWSPPSFKLSRAELDAIVAKVSPKTISDIQFAQSQIRRFAEHQRAALKDVEVETLPPEGLGIYGRICGWTLARAHARSGDRIAIGAYLGKGETFDQAIAEFSERYADQNELDFRVIGVVILFHVEHVDRVSRGLRA